jgi:Short C-terminal domain
MMSRRIAVLAALWLVLIIVPALVAARLLPLAGDTAHKGWVVGIWVAGYVAQLLVFRAMSRRSPRPVGLGWVIASTVPWAADWTAPLSPWAVAVCAAIVIAYAAWLVNAVHRVDRLRGEGLRGSAVVLEVIRPTVNAVVNKDSVRRALRVSVEGAHGAPAYEARLSAPFTFGDIPEAGDRLAVLIDPADPRHVEPIPDEPIERAAPVPEDLDADVAAQLRKLATMRDRGDLTDAEFTTAKNRLLNP